METSGRGEFLGVRFLGRRQGAVLGIGEGLGDGLLGLPVEGVEPPLRQGLGEPPAQPPDGVAGTPGSHLLFRLVAALVAGRETGHAVGLGLDQGRAVAASGAGHRVRRRPIDGDGIVAVHLVSRHAIALSAHRDVLDRGLVAGVHRQTVLVVLADEDDGELP